MSKSLVKLIDYSLLPALSMVFGKFLGIVLVSRSIGVDVTIREYSNYLFSLPTYINEEQLRHISSYSDLVMYAFVLIVFITTLIRAIFFHDSHLKPSLSIKLIDKNLFHLVQSTYEIYHAATIHLIFLWITTLLVLFNSLIGHSYLIVGIFSFVASIVSTGILLKDVYREIENIKTKPGSYNWQ